MTATEKISDFKDWISPIMVKELRQGMRTKLFTTAFIVLQGFMVLFVMVGFAESGGGGGASSGFFWFLVNVTLLVVMPLRGFGALSSEIRQNTMDLIALTRMSAWRITVGKWAALVSQSVLLTVGVLPYVVLRYFFGGIDPINELFLLTVALTLSCLLSAGMVGLSAFPSFLVRALIAIGASISAIFATTGISGSVAFSAVPLSDPDFLWGVFGFFCLAAFLIYYFLSMGATRIAPEALNYTTLRRVLSIVCLTAVMALPIVFPNVEGEPLFFIGSSLMGLFAMDALTESPSGVRSLYLPFIRRGPLGQIFGFFLTPGWFSGVFYVLLLGGIYILAGLAYVGSDFGWSTAQTVTVGVAATGSLLFPLLVIHLFYSQQKNLFASYFFIHVATAAIAICLMLMQHELPAVMWAGSPIPMVNYLMAVESSPGTYDDFLLVLGLTTLACTVLVCIWRAAPLIRQQHGFRTEYYRQKRPHTANSGVSAESANS